MEATVSDISVLETNASKISISSVSIPENFKKGRENALNFFFPWRFSSKMMFTWYPTL